MKWCAAMCNTNSRGGVNFQLCIPLTNIVLQHVLVLVQHLGSTQGLESDLSQPGSQLWIQPCGKTTIQRVQQKAHCNSAQRQLHNRLHQQLHWFFQLFNTYIHICICIYIHTCMHTYRHTGIQTYRHTYITLHYIPYITLLYFTLHAYIHIYIYTYLKNTCIFIHIHRYIGA